METWRNHLAIDPLPALLSSGNAALEYFVKQDLLDENPGPIDRVWELPAAQKIFRKQNPDGSLGAPRKTKHPAVNYGLIDTWKQFRFAVEKYGFNRADPATARAAEFIFSCQTAAGDIRGMLANQYATYYTGALLSLLIKAGYENDPRVGKGIHWLLSLRQDDGGWSVPIITHKFDGKTMYRLTSEEAEPVEPDRSKPFSHNATGMVLRAFAAHKKHGKTKAAKHAAYLLKSRFFEQDRYTSYRSADHWTRFQFPFWWNNLVAALDSVSLIDPSPDEQMEKALGWIAGHQEKDGLWRLSYAKQCDETRAAAKEMKLWVTLAVCRILRRVWD